MRLLTPLLFIATTTLIPVTPLSSHAVLPSKPYRSVSDVPIASIQVEDIRAEEQFSEANHLFEEGLERLKDIEALNQAYRDLWERVFVDQEPFFEDVLDRGEYFEIQVKTIDAQRDKLRGEAVQNWLKALQIYRDSNVRNKFPVDSRRSEAKIIIELIEIDSAYDILEPKNLRSLILQTIESHRDSSFRSAFPLESLQGEQDIITKLMMPNTNFPAWIIKESVFQHNEVKDLVRQILASYQDPQIEVNFPVESRQGQKNILEVLSPPYTDPFQRREFLEASEKIALWQRLLEDYRDSNFRDLFPQESLQGEGSILARLIFFYWFEIGQLDQALESFNQSFSIANQLNDRLLLLEVLTGIVPVYWLSENYQGIINVSEETISVVRELQAGMRNGSDSILNEKISHLTLEEMQIFEEELKQLEARRIYDIGTAYLALGKPQRALDYYDKSSEISPDCFCIIDYRTNIPLNLGIANWLTGNYETSANIYAQINQESVRSYPLDYSAVLAGRAYENLAHYSQALTFYQQILASSSNNENWVEGNGSEIFALYSLGHIYSSLGQYQTAIDTYEQAILVSKRPENHEQIDWESIIFADIGRIYLMKNDYARAIDLFEQALPRIRQIIFDVASNHQSYDSFQAGRTITQQVILRHWEGSLLADLGTAYAELGQFSQSIEFLKSSLKIANEAGDFAVVSQALRQLGKTHVALNLHQEAFGYYQQALAIARQVGIRSEEGQVLGEMGRLLLQEQQIELATVLLKASVTVRESIRDNIRGLSTDLQQSYTNTVADDYRFLADLLLQQNRVLEAQQVLDLLKVQELDDYLRGVQRSNTQTGVSLRPDEQALFDRFNAHQAQLIALNRELTDLEAIDRHQRTDAQISRVRELRQLQEAQQISFSRFLDDSDIQAAIQRLRYTTKAETVEIQAFNDLRDNLAKLDHAVVIYPLVLEDRLELILVTPYGPPINRTIPVNRVDLNRTIAEFRSALNSPNSDPRPAAQQLYDWLIRPLEADLTQAGATTLLYAPDGQLRYIPLAALHDGNQWLIQRFAVNNITAASLDDLNAEPPDQLTILAAALTEDRNVQLLNGHTQFFPGLVYARQEVDSVAQLIPTTDPHFNQDFSKALLYDFNDYSIIHLATHATFQPGAPENSFILFGDGQANLSEVKERWQFPNVDLVVLSACETGVGDELGDGTEILGFGYLMQQAGADAAIASLWSVSDPGTQAFMTAFYQQLQARQPKAKALQAAQIALIQGNEGTAAGRDRASARITPRNGAPINPDAYPGYSHPYYWAPFILIGNGL